MEISLRIFLSVAILVYFVILATLLKKRRLSLKYAIIWIICGVCMILFIVFPTVVFKASALVGISNPVNAIFFLAMVFTIILLLSITSIVSSLSEKNLRLTQALSLAEQRIYTLENERKEIDTKDKK